MSVASCSHIQPVQDCKVGKVMGSTRFVTRDDVVSLVPCRVISHVLFYHDGCIDKLLLPEIVACNNSLPVSPGVVILAVIYQALSSKLQLLEWQQSFSKSPRSSIMACLVLRPVMSSFGSLLGALLSRMSSMIEANLALEVQENKSIQHTSSELLRPSLKANCLL